MYVLLSHFIVTVHFKTCVHLGIVKRYHEIFSNQNWVILCHVHFTYATFYIYLSTYLSIILFYVDGCSTCIHIYVPHLFSAAEARRNCLILWTWNYRQLVIRLGAKAGASLEIPSQLRIYSWFPQTGYDRVISVAKRQKQEYQEFKVICWRPARPTKYPVSQHS